MRPLFPIRDFYELDVCWSIIIIMQYHGYHYKRAASLMNFIKQANINCTCLKPTKTAKIVRYIYTLLVSVLCVAFNV